MASTINSVGILIFYGKSEKLGELKKGDGYSRCNLFFALVGMGQLENTF